MFCTNCGYELKEGDRFCENCGAPVENPPVENPPVENPVKTIKEEPVPIQPENTALAPESTEAVSYTHLVMYLRKCVPCSRI